MSVLLPPENDFLSLEENNEDEAAAAGGGGGAGTDEDGSGGVDEATVVFDWRGDREEATASTPPFTLNVKRGASVPGTRLAVRGMRRLFRTSAGLELDFRRALGDIVARHGSFVDRVDRRLEMGDIGLGGGGGGFGGGDGRRMTGDGNASSQSPGRSGVLTPSPNEGIEALAALGDQFSQPNPAAIDEGIIEYASPRALPFTPSSKSDSSCRPFQSPDDDRRTTPIAERLSAMKGYGTPSLLQKDVEEEIEMLAFGERVDKGIVVREDERMGGDLPSASSRYYHDADDHYDEDDEDQDDFLVEEEQLGVTGLEKALTQLGTQATEVNEEESSPVSANDDDDIEDSRRFEIDYLLRDQLSGEDDCEELLSDDEDCFTTPLNNGAGVAEDTFAENKKDRYQLSNLSQPSKETVPNDDAGCFFVEEYFTSPQLCTKNRELATVDNYVSQKHSVQLLAVDFIVEPQMSTTMRCGKIMKQSQWSEPPVKPWHALPSDAAFETCPPWFLFQWKSEGPSHPTKPCGGSFLEPVKRPPSYSQVKLWAKAHRKGSTPPTKNSNKLVKKQKAVPSAQVATDEAAVGNDGSQASSYLYAYTQYSQLEGESQETPINPLAGLGQQGCKVRLKSILPRRRSSPH